MNILWLTIVNPNKLVVNNPKIIPIIPKTGVIKNIAKTIPDVKTA